MQETIYKVIAYNLDIKDGYFLNTLFFKKEAAFKYAEEQVKEKQGKNPVIDITGNLKSYEDKNLEYEMCHNQTAIYYRSHFGNYRMVIYIAMTTIY